MSKEDLIRESIKKFEEFNDIQIENYVSDEYVDDTGKNLDNYIGKDIFYKHIKEWLEFFEDDEQHILLKLLENYRYYPENKMRKNMLKLIQTVKEKNDCNVEEIYFITFPSKDGVKSGGDDLRSLLELVGIGKIKKDNIIADSNKNIQNILENAKVVVFLDDIVGSGMTLYGNIKKCIQKLKLAQHKEIILYVAVLYGREKKIKQKIKDIEKLGVNIEYILIENGRKCFDETEIFSKEEVQEFKEVVSRYERIIEENSEADGKSYVLGFNGNQLLISFNYNTPNNTLSNFWKPSKCSIPLFIRTSYVRPRIDDIRKYKENNQKNAYILGRKRINNVESE